MILTLLRSVRFAKAKKYAFNVFMPFSLQVNPITIKYIGKVKIATPAGSFECDRVSLISMQKTYNVYYEQQEPRRLIRYHEKNSNIALVLASNS